MAPRASASRKRAAAQSQSEEESDAGTDYDEPSASKAKAKSGKKKQAKKASQKGKAKGKKRAGSESDEPSDDDDDDDAPKGKKTLSTDEKNELVKELVRYALFSEYSRKPVRRDEVAKTLLAGKAKHFNTLIQHANKELKDLFGYELVPLRGKGEAVGIKAKAFALRSTLPLHLLQALAIDSPQSYNLEEKDGVNTYEGVNDMPTNVRDWQDAEEVGQVTARDLKKEEGGLYGVLGVILSLILVNGKVLPDDQLVSYLKKLQLKPDDQVPALLTTPKRQPSRNTGTVQHSTVSQYLTSLVKQGYLEKGKSATAQATQGGQAKSQKGDSGDSSIEWKWGARAEAEIGEVGIAKFIQEIYQFKPEGADAESEEDDEDENTQRKKAAQDKEDAQKKSDKLFREIARASGSKELSDVNEVEGL